ncbi:MAG: helix-turn-helix domain-containing protein [Microscillaceae bacterium]|nr:helix-turn-helix domain-containing protein [Microscillaceae bacterium]
MTEKKFSTYKQFLTTLKLADSINEASVYVLDINTISEQALMTFGTYRNNFYEINIIKNQREFIFYVDGIKYHPQGEPYVCFISPNRLQSYHLLGDDPEAEGYLIYIPKSTTNIIQNFEKVFTFFQAEYQSYFNPNETVFKQLWAIAQDLHTEFEGTSRYKEKLLIAKLEVFLYKCLEQFGAVKSILITHPEKVVSEFERLISEHIDLHKDLGFYAKELALTPKRLSELCKKVKGKNALELLHEKQKLRAEALLLQTTLTVKEVAFEMGFEEVSNFVRFFKKQSGITPNTFRAKQKN